MMFVDEARVFVKAGDGGRGCESHYRDKYMRHPRPDGGDGGPGGDVRFIADRNIQTLLDFRFQQHYKAKDGGHASSKGKTGRAGQDSLLRVPIGTIIRDATNDLVIKDLTIDGQSVVVAHGGTGGIGNMQRRVPLPPKPGEQLTIRLELKIIADVGIIGFPNAGKSTLICQISKVKSPVANYPFTTKHPILGFVQSEDMEFVIADLPGIIEGAHEGRGLGFRFLKHAERTKVLIHMVDMAGSEMRDPLEDYAKVNLELDSYSEDLSGKTRLVVANKMDLPEASNNLKRFKRKFKIPVITISAVSGNGTQELIKEIYQLLCIANSPDPLDVSS